jgi:hypothetical protein
MVRNDGMTMEVPPYGIIHLTAAATPGPAVLGVRAERLRIGGIQGMNQIAGVLERSIFAGDSVTHSIRTGNGISVLVTEAAHAAACPGGEVTLSFPPSSCLVFPA